MVDTDNIKIRQNWVEEEAESYAAAATEAGAGSDGFLMLGAALLLGCPVDEIDPEDIVDGGEDKQIDFIHIEDDQQKGHADILIAQSKSTKGFSSNTVVQIKNGLDWIFERPKKEVLSIANDNFKQKILEIRELRRDYGASNISVSVFHITNGDKSTLSKEYLDEAGALKLKYESLDFADFRFDQIGAHELVELINAEDRTKRKIDIEIPIVYDINRPSLMQFAQGDTKSFVCTVTGEALAVAGSSEPRDAIFDMNVRPYYGSTGKVNREIWETCTDEESKRFWFLNNGVTLVCDSFDFNSDPDAPIVRIKNAQIVNGCQTTVTVREAYEKKSLRPETRVLLRIYATDNPSLVEKITLSTNNQNKITDRDLRANDPVQRDIEQLMHDKYGYFYERKNKQYRALKGPNKKKIVHSPKAAQAYLAIVRFKPSNARGYLNAIWSDFYGEIFENASIPDLLVAYKIHQHCHQEALKTKELTLRSQAERDCRVYGAFHIARAMGHHLTNDLWGHANIGSVEKWLNELEGGKTLDEIYSSSLALVVSLREEDEKEYLVPALYFKNTVSQRKLNAKLKSSGL
ncbi:AIPR family protein [Porticoccus sp.]